MYVKERKKERYIAKLKSKYRLLEFLSHIVKSSFRLGGYADSRRDAYAQVHAQFRVASRRQIADSIDPVLDGGQT